LIRCAHLWTAKAWRDDCISVVDAGPGQRQSAPLGFGASERDCAKEEDAIGRIQ
jgi:hypothetical protein